MAGNRTYVYIDGFNLYYRCLRNTEYRWLDLVKLCQLMLPKNDVLAIKYFTALVKPRPGDPSQPIRQQTYLRALKTLPNCEVVLGHFLTHKVWMPAANMSEGQEPYVRVIKTEEKGSDVNLATHLLCDAFEDRYDVAVVVSNDSDLAMPLSVVAERMGKTAGLLSPIKHPSFELIKHARFCKRIRKGVLSASQFPPILKDEHGTFHRPEEWA